MQKALASQLWVLVVHSLISERKAKKKEKKKKKAPFLKAASERKDKLTYDHVVLFRLCLLMQDFAITYNRYLKELLTKKNCHFFQLNLPDQGKCVLEPVIAGCRQFGSFQKVNNERLPCTAASGFDTFAGWSLREIINDNIAAAITKTMTANRHMTILKEVSIRRCFSLLITTPCSIAPFKLLVLWQQFGSKRMVL